MGLLSLQLVATGWRDCLLVAVSFCLYVLTPGMWITLFLQFLASGRAPGKVMVTCSDEFSNFGLRATCFII